jgi:hypothetical protein
VALITTTHPITSGSVIDQKSKRPEVLRALRSYLLVLSFLMATAILLSRPFRPQLPLTYRPSIRPTPHRQAGIRVEPRKPRPFA